MFVKVDEKRYRRTSLKIRGNLNIFSVILCHGFTAYLCRVPLTARITRRMIFQFKRPPSFMLLFYAEEDRKGNAQIICQLNCGKEEIDILYRFCAVIHGTEQNE